MGATFQRWLAKPSTLCFLRRVLVTAGPEAIAGTTSIARATRRRQHTYAPFEIDLVDGKHGQEQDEQHEAALSKSAPSHAPKAHSHLGSEKAFSALWHRANAMPKDRKREPVLDSREKWRSAKYWAELLNDRQRLYGFNGVQEVWKGMMFRQFELPTSGPEADLLWPVLIDAGIADHRRTTLEKGDLLKEVIEHARYLRQEYGLVYSGLYRCIVGHFVSYEPDEAPQWHRVLVDDFGFSTADLRTLARRFATSHDPAKARKCFDAIYKPSNERDLYDDFVPELLQHLDERSALKWHRYFLQHGDAPGPTVFQTPSVQRLFELDRDKSLPMIHNKEASKSSNSASINTSADQFPSLNRSSMSALVGEAHGIDAKEVGDSFVARLFATSAFPLEFVTKTLSFFAVDKLGPLSIHEMAMRCGDLDTFVKQLEALKRMGVELGTSVYGRLMAKVASDRLPRTFQALLRSDQHPESYGDSRTQQLLLAQCLREHDSSGADVALMALSLAGKQESAAAWETVLQHHIYEDDLQSAIKVMQQMQTHDVVPTHDTLLVIHKSLLSPRRRGQIPNATKESAIRLRFAENVYMYAAKKRLSVHCHLWAEILKRYGMTNRWKELETLVRWLFSWYSAPETHYENGRTAALPFEYVLAKLFTFEMQKAIVAWAFQDAVFRDRLRPATSKSAGGQAVREPWARGIALLKEVPKPPTFELRPQTLRIALRLRLWILFGPAWSHRQINQRARQVNRLTLGHFIQHANDIWGSPLFKVDPAFLQAGPARHAQLLVALFGPKRQVSYKRRENADVAAYARQIAHGWSPPVQSRAYLQGVQWERSPFRFRLHIPDKEPSGKVRLNLPSHQERRSRRLRRLRAARSSSSHPPPSPQGTPAVT